MGAAVQRDPADPTTSPLESEISFYANPHPRSHEGRYKEMEGDVPTVWSYISVHEEWDSTHTHKTGPDQGKEKYDLNLGIYIRD
jgi:hypothetical protein